MPTRTQDFKVIGTDTHNASVLKKARKDSRTGGRARALQILPPDAPIESLLNNLDSRRAAVDTLFACLKAERTYYDLFSKSMVTEPDYSTRCAAARTLLAY